MTSVITKLTPREVTAARIAARKAAEELVAIAVGECEGQPLEFTTRLWEILRDKAIDNAGLPPRAVRVVEPMNDNQAARFAKVPMPFGKFRGVPIGELERTEPHYLPAIADGGEFNRDLKRYLARHKHEQETD